MASIDAFWELAAGESVSKTAQRVSLRRLAPAAMPVIDRRAERQRAWILVGVALLHALFLLALRAAMHPLAVVHHEASTPLQITFIERRPALVVPTHIVTPPAPVVTPQALLQPRSLPQPQRIAPRTDALQAVTIESPVKPVETTPPRAVLFDTDGALRVSQTPQPSHPRNLLAHRNVSFMLPGGARSNSPDFHVRPGLSPQSVVNSAGRAVSQLIGNAARVERTDSDGVAPVVADRGLRTSGRDSDPCEDIALDMVDLNDAKTRDQAEEQYEQSCEGH